MAAIRSGKPSLLGCLSLHDHPRLLNLLLATPLHWASYIGHSGAGSAVCFHLHKPPRPTCGSRQMLIWTYIAAEHQPYSASSLDCGLSSSSQQGQTLHCFLGTSPILLLTQHFRPLASTHASGRGQLQQRQAVEPAQSRHCLLPNLCLKTTSKQLITYHEPRRFLQRPSSNYPCGTSCSIAWELQG